MTDQLEMTFATAADVCELVFGDPMHAAERQAVIDAIVAVARRDGDTDPNRVRPHIPSWVGPRVVSATWGALRNRGLLEPIGWTTNTDAKGRNVGKPQRKYRVVGELA